MDGMTQSQTWVFIGIVVTLLTILLWLCIKDPSNLNGDK